MKQYAARDIHSITFAFHKIVAQIAGVKDVDFTVLAKDDVNEHSAILKVDDKNTFVEDIAIARYFARTGDQKDQLLGSNIFDQSKVDQWLSWTNINIRFTAEALIAHISGKATEETLDFKAANANLRSSLKFLNSQLKGRKNLVGDSLTIADIYVTCHLIKSFQLVLEPGFRKGVADLTSFITLVVSHDLFKAQFGNIKFCARPLKPYVKPGTEVKTEKADKKEENKGDKKDGKKGDKKDNKKDGKKDDKKGGKKGDKKGGKKQDDQAEEIIGVPDDVEFADPIYAKYKTIFKNAIYGKVITRFPPEPSGFLHIGHIKASMINYHYAKVYNGKMILRFDDTNPSKEKIEFVQNITKDLKTVEIIPAKTTYTSDYFDQLQDKMREFIKIGMAYADNTPGDQMKIERDAGIDSVHKTKEIQENLDIFEKMLLGEAKGWCIRANLNMQDKVKCLRDPVMYRNNDTPHHRTGTKYKAYPTYDFACPIVDALEDVSNCLRTIEYMDRDPLYHLIQKKLGMKEVDIFEYGKLKFKSTLMSKRKLQWFVDEGLVEGWHDPRFPTVQGLMRRGLTVQTLKEFMLSQGASVNTINMEWDKLWATNKMIIDPIAKRFYAIFTDSAAEVIIENGPETPEGISIDYHQKVPELGSKVRILTNHLYIERDDVEDLKVGDKFTLSRWGNVYIKSKEEVDGKLRLSVELNLEDKDFKSTTKAIFVPKDSRFNMPITIFEFGHLITKDAIREEDDVANFVNKNSKIQSTAYGEKDLATLRKGDFLQIERRGYYFVDKDIQNDGEIVLHFIPDGKPKGMSKIKGKIDADALTKGEGETGKAANKADQAKLTGAVEEEGKELSKKALKKLANKEKKKQKKQDHQEDAKQE